MSWPILTTDVTGYLGVEPAGAADQVALDRATSAVVRFCTRNDVAPPLHVEPAAEPDGCGYADAELGAVMLAARWYARRSSSQGIAAFGDFGPAYVTKNDPDVATLLGLGKPQAG
jgi:hypothetical protein